MVLPDPNAEVAVSLHLSLICRSEKKKNVNALSPGAVTDPMAGANDLDAHVSCALDIFVVVVVEALIGVDK